MTASTVSSPGSAVPEQINRSDHVTAMNGRRWIFLVSVLAAIHLLGIFLSDAPPRLQLLRSLAWSLPIIPAAAWLWNRRVLPSIRLSGILAFSAVVALATLSVGAYHTKLEVSLISYLAGLVGWLVYLIVVVGLAMVVESAWNRAWRQAGRL